MKNQIKVLGETIFYEEESYNMGQEYFENTNFYVKNGTKPEKKWSWRKFRMADTGVLLPNYEIILSLNFLISKNYNLSREELLKKVEDSYRDYIKKQKRKEELNNGIVI